MAITRLTIGVAVLLCHCCRCEHHVPLGDLGPQHPRESRWSMCGSRVLDGQVRRCLCSRQTCLGKVSTDAGQTSRPRNSSLGIRISGAQWLINVAGRGCYCCQKRLEDPQPAKNRWGLQQAARLLAWKLILNAVHSDSSRL